ncbi:hypothetical protein ACWGH2_00030 [Streptomyces sp. NPDC054871]
MLLLNLLLNLRPNPLLNLLVNLLVNLPHLMAQDLMAQAWTLFRTRDPLPAGPHVQHPHVQHPHVHMCSRRHARVAGPPGDRHLVEDTQAMINSRPAGKSSRETGAGPRIGRAVA